MTVPHHAAKTDTAELAGYELIDLGGGRKLESFGGRLVDRPSPAADGTRLLQPKLWPRAQSHFDAKARHWTHRQPWPESLSISCGKPAYGTFIMPVFPTPFGHVGVFPEQEPNWRWLIETAPKDDSPDADRPEGLNLFGYTGASTMAMAVSGMKVAHVDAAKPNVAVARRAAELNGLVDHPIRYLVDDAAKFAAREVRRGRRYHTIVLDPPAYGHSPGGKAWRLERDLWPLLESCLALLSMERFRLLVTGHSPQVGAPDVVDYLEENLEAIIGEKAAESKIRFQSGRLTLADRQGRRLDAGFFVRCSRNSTH